MRRDPAVVEVPHPPLGITPEYLHELFEAALSAGEAAVIARWTAPGEPLSPGGNYKVSPKATACFDLERCRELAEKGELTVSEVPITFLGDPLEATIVFSRRDGMCRAHVASIDVPCYEPEENREGCPYYDGEFY